MTLTLNERAKRLADQLMTEAAGLRIDVSRSATGARLIDCGIQAEGGLRAGLSLARICMADLADVTILPGEIAGVTCPHVQVLTDFPVLACMASQYAGWQSKKLPTEEVIQFLSDKLKMPPDRLALFVAPASSQAGTIQVVARSLETALHKLYEMKFDLNQVVSGVGTAPLPPVAVDEIQAIGWTNDAILYGGRVTLWVRGDDEQIREIGPRVSSSASADHGEPFAAIFKRYHNDFYKIDPMLFSPAEIVFRNLKTGRTQAFGTVSLEILQSSFFAGS